MKRNRLILAILWILSLVGISFFGGPVSYGFFALFTFAPLVCFIYLVLVYFFFHIYQEVDGKYLVADHVTPFNFILINEFHFGFVSVRVRFYSSFSNITDLDDGVEYELLPNTGITKKTGINCKYRGEYEIGIKTVELVDFFRIFHLSYRNKEPRRVVVKPNAVKLCALRSIELSQATARDMADNMTKRDIPVRKYEPGDDLRYINWKATARSGELLVHKKTGEEKEGVGILLGTNRYSKEPKEFIPIENKMLETAIALTMYFCDKNIPVRSYHLSSSLNEINVSDLAQFDSYYSSMSAVSFREEQTEDALLEEVASRPEIYRCRVVFMVLHELTEKAVNVAKLLHENNVHVVLYIVNDDITDSFTERIPGVEIFRISGDDDLTEVM